MSAFIRYLPAAALVLPWLTELATWLVDETNKTARRPK